MPADLHDRLKHWINKEEPLGPPATEHVEDDECAAYMFDPHYSSFSKLVKSDINLIIGRKGSGKTSIIRSYKVRKYLSTLSLSASNKSTFDLNEYQHVIELTQASLFREMQERVARTGSSFELPVEELENEWEHLLGRFVVLECLDYIRKVPKRHEFDHARKILDDLDSFLHQDERVREKIIEELVRPSIKSWLKSTLFKSRKEDSQSDISAVADALKACDTLLGAVGCSVLLILDSMDEYDVGERRINRTVGALTRFVSRFNVRYTNLQIKMCLPSEIYPEIRRASANALRDLVAYNSVRWNEQELAAVAAHRIRIYFELYDRQMFDKLKSLQLARRHDVRRFWLAVFPSMVNNRYETAESVITYVLRHTQLLPRQLFAIISDLIKQGHGDKLSGDEVRDIVARSEDKVTGEIYNAYNHVYPFAEQVIGILFANMPTVFSFDELDARFRRYVRNRVLANVVNPANPSHGFEIGDLTEMLSRMGVIGEFVRESEKYIEARFAYTEDTKVTLGEGHRICLHPIFSKSSNAAQNSYGKAVLPIGSGLDNDA